VRVAERYGVPTCRGTSGVTTPEDCVLKGFKDFLLRGNIIDLAVAVVIGTAFTALVASFSTNLISPLIARLGGGGPGDGLYVKLGDSEETWLKVGDFLASVITFTITAAVVYFLVVVPMRTIMERRRNCSLNASSSGMLNCTASMWFGTKSNRWNQNAES